MQPIPEGSTAGVATAGRVPRASDDAPAGRAGLRLHGFRLHWALLIAVAGGVALAVAVPPARLWPLAAAGWAAIGGPPLLSFVVAVTGAMLAWLVLRAVVRTGVRTGDGTGDGTGLRTGPDRRRLLTAVAATAVTAGIALSGTLLPVDGA